MAINVATSVCPSGYSYVGVNLLKALDRLGAEPSLFPIGPVDLEAFPDDHPLLDRCLKRASFFDPGAPSVRVWHQYPTGGLQPHHGMADSPGRGRRLGFPFVELDRLRPVEVHHLNSLDTLIQPSEWAAGICRRSGVTVPQAVIPPAVDPDIFWQDELPAGDETVFVHAGKAEYRKGLPEIREAFLRAFTPRDKVRLILLTENPFLSPTQQEEWRTYLTHHVLGDKVELVPRLRTQRDVARVLRRAHCGLFPARAEGFNLEAAEMLAMGRHCVMTDYAGHTAYAREAGASLIAVTDLEPAHDGIWFYADDPAWDGRPGRWARVGEAEVDALAAALRGIHEVRAEGNLRLNEQGVEFFTRWTWDEAARRLCEVAFG